MTFVRRHRRHLPIWVAAGVVVAMSTVAMSTAPVAMAKPTCTDVAPSTTMCQTPGHARITTTPPARVSGPQYGWPLGGVVIGLL